MSILESEYKEDLTIEQGKALVAKAIRSGIFNDLGSGGNVDVCVITREGGTIFRNMEKPNERKFKAQYKGFPKASPPHSVWSGQASLMAFRDGLASATPACGACAR